MAKGMTITEFARMGGKARAQKLSKEELSEQGRNAVKARWAKHPKKASAAREAKRKRNVT